MFDVVTIGTATRDVFLTSDLFKILKDPKHLRRIGFSTGEAQCFALGAKVNVVQRVEAVGGGAANAAVTFARRGLKTAAIVKIGDDTPGRLIREDFDREGITSLARLDRKKGTASSVILLSYSGERTVLVYRGASEDLRAADVPEKTLKSRWAYITPGKIPISVIYKLVRRLRRKGAHIAMNPSKHYIKLGIKRIRVLLETLDVIIVNREEAAALTGYSFTEERKIFKKFDDVVMGLAVMTDGPRGVIVSDGRRIFKTGIYKERRVADRTGAGDAFGSGFIAGLAEKKSKVVQGRSYWFPDDIAYAIRLATANATSVVEHIGAQRGILRKREFATQRRWKNLCVKEHKI